MAGKKKGEKIDNASTTPLAEKTKADKPALLPVEELAEQKKVKAWELAGMMRAIGWAEGKQLGEAEFDQAVKAFRNRPQGSGKIIL